MPRQDLSHAAGTSVANRQLDDFPNGLGRKFARTIRWLPGYAWQRLTRSSSPAEGGHLMIAVADHFEPAILPHTNGGRAPRDEQERRLEHWCRNYPEAVCVWPDSDGRTFCHTYFYPAEQYDRGLIERLADHCHQGWGEIEIQLHHGTWMPDTPANTRRQLVEFRDALVGHECLSKEEGQAAPRYAFVHGNFALANSGGGIGCGVDGELQILAETGCYADFTLPSAPHPAQVAKINSLYECTLPLDRRAPHRRGRGLERGHLPRVFPLMVQGPLLLDVARRKRGLPFPRIENGALTAMNPPTLRRFHLWRKAAIAVCDCPDWLFIKLSCHGMDPRDEEAMLGASLRSFLRELREDVLAHGRFRVHFVTAREMVNIILAACDGREGNPRDYRDYRLKAIRSSPLVCLPKSQQRAIS
jgi:hypothetical protein